MSNEQGSFNQVPDPSKRFFMTHTIPAAAALVALPLIEFAFPWETLPSEVLDLTSWKLTLPIGPNGHPIEVTQPQLDEFQHRTYFKGLKYPNGEKAVRFRAPVTGVTTENSDYPRCELREMTADGSDEASWSSTEGVHSLYLDQAITATPENKRHLVAGQIHDEDDDRLVVRLEIDSKDPTDSELFIDVDGDNMFTLEESYKLGTRFTVQFVVHDGLTEVYYNGSEEPVYVLEQDYKGAYFKAGAYPQSNCEKEKDEELCTPDNYGEVRIYNAVVTHQ